jgi:hypothetical protein
MNARVTAVISVMHGALADELSIATLSKRVNLSPARLRQLFKTETGRSPMQYLKELRMQEYGQRKSDDPGAVLSLRPGQELKDLLFRLVPSGVVAGRILDEDGEPVNPSRVVKNYEVVVYHLPDEG